MKLTDKKRPPSHSQKPLGSVVEKGLFLLLLSVFLLILLSYRLGWELSADTYHWVRVWGVILGPVIGLQSSYALMSAQMRIDRKRRLEEKEPIIVPGEYRVKRLEDFRRKDLSEEGTPLQQMDTFSLAGIPLYNTGETPIYDLRFQFNVENLKEIIKDSTDKAPKNRQPSLSPEPSQGEVDAYLYHYEDYTQTFSAGEWIGTHPVLRPGEEVELNLDAQSVITLIHYMSSSIYRENLYRPRIHVEVFFKDYLFVDHRLTFELSFVYRINGDCLSTFSIKPIFDTIENEVVEIGSRSHLL